MEQPARRCGKSKWIGLSLLLVLVALAASTWLGVSALGRKLSSGSVPGLTFQYLDLGWRSVGLRGGRYELSGPTIISVASRSLTARPSFFSFLIDRVTVAEVEVDQPRFRIERTGVASPSAPLGPSSEQGALESSRESPARRSVELRRLVLKEGSGTFIDRTVGTRPVQILFGRLEGSVGDLKWPEEEGPSHVSLNCILHGKPDGTLRLEGWFDPAAGSADITLHIAGCDLNLFHPYLAGQMHTVSETSGVGDLDLALTMTGGLYEAKGELRLRNMEIPASSEKFLGVPARILREYLKLGSNRLAIPFTFRGNIREERFPPDMGTLLAGVLTGRLKISPKVTPEQLEKIDKGLKKLKDLLR